MRHVWLVRTRLPRGFRRFYGWNLIWPFLLFLCLQSEIFFSEPLTDRLLVLYSFLGKVENVQDARKPKLSIFSRSSVLQTREWSVVLYLRLISNTDS